MIDSIDLNGDVGEVSREQDDAILPFVSSCNVSCGVHAGNPILIAGTVREALRLGVAVGAHPSYPDREHFGRRSMKLPSDEIADHLRYQISAVQGMVASLGGQLSHVKPHGALYNDIARNSSLAEIVIDVVKQVAPAAAFYGQANSHLAQLCQERQMRFVHEVFADRRYENAIELRSRDQADAILQCPEELQKQIDGFLNGYVIDVRGQKHSLSAQTICLHGDTPDAIEFARLANLYLEENHVRLAAP